VAVNAGGTEAAGLAPFVMARGLERIARDAGTAAEWMRSGKGEPSERLRTARDLLDASIEKEEATIASVRTLAPLDAAVASALASRQDEWRAAARTIRDAVLPRAAPAAAAGKSGRSDAEVRLEKKVPKKAAETLNAWLALERRAAEKRSSEARARREQPVREPEEKKLTALMQFEALNWVDGNTDAATIARRVCAEALSAGAWYYGECTPEMVEKFFESEERDGLITMATRAP
jgi:hypothetical protein